MSIRIGNAPVSWGIYSAGQPNTPKWEQVLDAIAAAGYDGTELGPYGYYPADPEALRAALEQRGLALGSSYVGLTLADPATRPQAVERCLEVARLLSSQGVLELIVADEGSPRRAAIAGRVPADGAGWSSAQLGEAARTLDLVSRAVAERYGMRLVIHHHAGTFIETAQEIEAIMAATDPERVGLLIDTGHAVYGGADPLALLERFGARVRYVHLKDVDRGELARVRQTEIAMSEAWRRGVFCPLGQGVVDLGAFCGALVRRGFSGWAIVEQDVVAQEDGSLHPDPFRSAQSSREFLRREVGL
jgi:inosose dehydratase